MDGKVGPFAPHEIDVNVVVRQYVLPYSHVPCRWTLMLNAAADVLGVLALGDKILLVVKEDVHASPQSRTFYVTDAMTLPKQARIYVGSVVVEDEGACHVFEDG